LAPTHFRRDQNAVMIGEKPSVGLWVGLLAGLLAGSAARLPPI